MHDWSGAFFSARKVVVLAVPLHLEVYVAAIAAHHDAVDGRSLGKHDLIVRFLGPLYRQRGSFKPLHSFELKFLSAKTALLTLQRSLPSNGSGTSRRFR